LDLVANDVDVDGTLNRQSIVITSSPKSGTVTFNPDGSIQFIPDPTFLGIDTFRYTVRDNSGATSNQGVVNVTVTDENFAPVANNDTATTRQDEPVTITPLVNDTDADGTLVVGSIAVTDQPDHGSVTVNLDGSVVYQPATGYVGPDSFQYTVRDDANEASNPATVTVTVTDAGPPWQNPVNPLDVDRSGAVVPLDALLVINEINARGSRPLDPPPLPGPPVEPPPFVDVNGDDFLSPIDALLVINHLNNPGAASTARSPVKAINAINALAAPQWIGAALDIEPRRPAPTVEARAAELAFAVASPRRSRMDVGRSQVDPIPTVWEDDWLDADEKVSDEREAPWNWLLDDDSFDV
jgi:hypothetical protein